MLNFLYINAKLKLQTSKLNKKMGDDKLVVSLVLIAVGVVLCFMFRNQITYVINYALNSLDTKISDMFNSTPAPGSTAPSP
jgi:hypothetical protein